MLLCVVDLRLLFTMRCALCDVCCFVFIDCCCASSVYVCCVVFIVYCVLLCVVCGLVLLWRIDADVLLFTMCDLLRVAFRSCLLLFVRFYVCVVRCCVLFGV